MVLRSRFTSDGFPVRLERIQATTEGRAEACNLVNGRELSKIDPAKIQRISPITGSLGHQLRSRRLMIISLSPLFRALFPRNRLVLRPSRCHFVRLILSSGISAPLLTVVRENPRRRNDIDTCAPTPATSHSVSVSLAKRSLVRGETDGDACSRDYSPQARVIFPTNGSRGWQRGCRRRAKGSPTAQVHTTQ